MQTVTDIASLRSIVRQWRRDDQSIAFVPTMGNLHAGHLQLVQTAQGLADKVVVSIFVNPTQFGPNEDFASYPRTEQQDAAQLATIGADLLFLPAVDEVYRQPSQTKLAVPALSSMLCGASRPGHFDGVALVVCKLLNQVQPDRLLLGEKDFQQLAVLRRMVADLDLPVQIHSVPTVREADGLAMSSRNGYLSDDERRIAPMLYQALRAVRDAIQRGQADTSQVLAQQSQRLQDNGFVIDYFQLCRQDDLQPADDQDHRLVLLIAARLGKTRLIDNLQFTRPADHQSL